jgi:hypothetical protein
MRNLQIDWVVRRFFSGLDNNVPVYSTREEMLEVGNFNSAAIMVDSDNANNMQLEIETAVDAGQSIWSVLTNGSFTLGTREETKFVQPGDAIPMYRWLRYRVQRKTAGNPWSGSLTIRILLKR